jgi:hypothetical protein
MIDPEERDMLWKFAHSLLRCGGAVGVGDLRWETHTICGAELTGNLPDQNETFVRKHEGTVDRSWSTSLAAAEDVVIAADRHDTLDNVVFFGTQDAGITWRMLKVDCPYLNMIFGKTNRALRLLDSRISLLSELIDKALSQKEEKEEKYDGRN